MRDELGIASGQCDGACCFIEDRHRHRVRGAPAAAEQAYVTVRPHLLTVCTAGPRA